ncbi:MAG: archease [Anaerolineae bacterium]|nr:archease [Anaerolineae bacterium]
MSTIFATMKRFEEIPHTADWSFRAFGKDVRELFENAAHALFALEGARARNDATPTTRAVHVTALDYESLLVNWLTELLWLQDTHREMYQQFDIISLTPTELRARVLGVPFVQLDKLIKAVTYHNLSIRQTAEGWEVVVVVDV